MSNEFIQRDVFRPTTFTPQMLLKTCRSNPERLFRLSKIQLAVENLSPKLQITCHHFQARES
jgi:hypothetical protein